MQPDVGAHAHCEVCRTDCRHRFLARSFRELIVELCLVPTAGLLFVSWFTRRYAPEAQGTERARTYHGRRRNNGVIRPRVSIIKILASGLCIGNSRSIGREGPIVQIGSSLKRSVRRLRAQ
jgi:CIC family chloride channel protein